MTAVSMAGAKTRTDSGRGRSRSFFSSMGFVRRACLVLLMVALVAVPLMQAHAAPGTQSIAMGSGGHKLQIRSDGTLWAWGYNSHGQLGLGDTTDRLVPTQAGTDTDWASVAAGGYAGVGHSLALKDDGTLWAWGYNNYGQLGLGDTTNRTVPTQVGTGSDWVSVTSGRHHSLAIKADGTLWVWGYNYFGQLGLGDTTNRTVPTQVGTDTDWAQAAGNSYSSYAIKTGGALWAWGYNAYGQLGLSDTTNRTAPTQVGADTDWAIIGCGESFAVGIRSDGTLWTWGDNANGQLGHGDTTGRNVPTQVGTDATWAQAEGGSRHVIAVRTDGTLWAWGLNYAGNLGLGDTDDRWVPTQVGTGSGWAFPVAGVNDSGALKADGSAWLWGYNLENHLGFGMGAPSRFVNPALLAAPPVLAAIGDKTVDELAELTFTATATDADLPANTLAYSLAAGAPAGAAIDGATGAFTWTPTEAQGPGSYDTTVTVSDGKGGTDSETITVTVVEVRTVLIPIAGSNRYATAVEASNRAYPDGAGTVVIATGENWPDALGGAALAGVLDAPVLLTKSGTLLAQVAAEITRLGASEIYVLGGEEALSSDVEDGLASMLGADDVHRIGGATRYETAELIAAEVVSLQTEYDGTAFVATGDNFADALAASPLAAANDWPVYLAPKPVISADTIAAMQAAGVTDVILLGGEAAMPDDTSITLLSVGISAVRIDGADRYETASKVAAYGVDSAGLSWSGVALANGDGFADALCGGAAQGQAGSVMLLTRTDSLPTATSDVLTANESAVRDVTFFGGLSAISQEVRDQVMSLF